MNIRQVSGEKKEEPTRRFVCYSEVLSTGHATFMGWFIALRY